MKLVELSAVSLNFSILTDEFHLETLNSEILTVPAERCPCYITENDGWRVF